MNSHLLKKIAYNISLVSLTVGVISAVFSYNAIKEGNVAPGTTPLPIKIFFANFVFFLASFMWSLARLALIMERKYPIFRTSKFQLYAPVISLFFAAIVSVFIIIAKSVR